MHTVLHRMNPSPCHHPTTTHTAVLIQSRHAAHIPQPGGPCVRSEHPVRSRIWCWGVPTAGCRAAAGDCRVPACMCAVAAGVLARTPNTGGTGAAIQYLGSGCGVPTRSHACTCGLVMIPCYGMRSSYARPVCVYGSLRMVWSSSFQGVECRLVCAHQVLHAHIDIDLTFAFHLLLMLPHHVALT